MTNPLWKRLDLESARFGVRLRTHTWDTNGNDLNENFYIFKKKNYEMKMWIFFGAGLLIVNRVGKEKYSRKKKSQLESHNIFFILTVAKCGVSDDDARWFLRGKNSLTFTTQSSDPDAMTLSLCGHHAMSSTGPLWPPTSGWSAGIRPT